VSLAGRSLNNGQWHSVNINARRNRVTLTLDNDPASPALETPWLQIYSGYSYYFGGKFPVFKSSQKKGARNRFQPMLCQLDNPPHSWACTHAAAFKQQTARKQNLRQPCKCKLSMAEGTAAIRVGLHNLPKVICVARPSFLVSHWKGDLS
jgi:hypothetical protein